LKAEMGSLNKLRSDDTSRIALQTDEIQRMHNELSLAKTEASSLSIQLKSALGTLEEVRLVYVSALLHVLCD
jgi:hypothetical protein